MVLSVGTAEVGVSGADRDDQGIIGHRRVVRNLDLPGRTIDPLHLPHHHTNVRLRPEDGPQGPGDSTGGRAPPLPLGTQQRLKEMLWSLRERELHRPGNAELLHLGLERGAFHP